MNPITRMRVVRPSSHGTAVGFTWSSGVEVGASGRGGRQGRRSGVSVGVSVGVTQRRGDPPAWESACLRAVGDAAEHELPAADVVRELSSVSAGR